MRTGIWGPGEGPERVAVAVGGLACAVAPFLAWLHVSVFGVDLGFSLTRLFSKSPGFGGLVYVFVVLGAVVTVGAVLVRSMTALRLAALGVGATVGLAEGLFAYFLVRAVHGSDGVGQVGVGLILAGVAAALLVFTPAIGHHRDGYLTDGERLAFRRVASVYPAWLMAGLCAILLAVPVVVGSVNCGTPLTATSRADRAQPSATPPPSVVEQETSDRQTLAAAQAAYNSAATGAEGALADEQAAAMRPSGSATPSARNWRAL